MTIDLESESYSSGAEKEPRAINWLKVGMVAAGSAIAGGLAAAWYYRNTLTLLREADAETVNSDLSRSSETDGD